MSYWDARVPVRVKNIPSQKMFQLFSRQVFSMFQDSEIIFSPGIAMLFQRQKLPLLVIREGGLSPFGSQGKGTGARVSHCDARVPVEAKNFSRHCGAQYS